MSDTNFPLYLPGLENPHKLQFSMVAADVGRIHVQMARYIFKDAKLQKQEQNIFNIKDFESFEDIFRKFQEGNNFDLPERVSLGVPGPVIGGKCVSDNLPWTLDEEELQKNLGVEKVILINDLEATAYRLAEVSEEDIKVLKKGNPSQHGNVAILAPGIGLGEAGLFFDGKCLRPFATEGGHSEFSPRDAAEVQFYQFLNQIYGIVTWEKVITVEGVFNIYRYLRDVRRHKETEELTKAIESEESFLDVIIDSATNTKTQISKMTMEALVEFMAREANNLVLKLKATGGLILAGDIPRKIVPFLESEKFYKKFIISDKMEILLKDIPIYILDDDKAILNGAAYYGAYYN